MNPIERQRRHDERWQHEVVDGLARMLDVLHDISDAVRELAAVPPERSTSSDPERETLPLLLSVTSLADALGVSPSTVRSFRASGHGPRPTKVGGRLFFHRDDVETWLQELRPADEARTRPWSGALLPGRIGSSLPVSSAPQKRAYCAGSHTEPMAASRYSGRAVCRACKDDVLVNKDGRLRKHFPGPW